MNQRQTATDDAEERPEELVLGYTTPLIARPGGRVEVRVSASANTYEASVVRLVKAGSEGRVVTEPAQGIVAPEGELTARECPTTFGSSIVVGPSDVFRELSSFTASAWIFPTLLTERPQIVIGAFDHSGEHGWRMQVDARRGLGLLFASPDAAPVELWSNAALPQSRWSHVAVTADVGMARLFQSSEGRPAETIEGALPTVTRLSREVLSIAAPLDRDRPVASNGNGCFNGKISRPVLLDAAIEPEQISGLRDGRTAELGAGVACQLDLSDAISSSRLRDRSEHRHGAVVLNMPTAGVTGPGWQARSSNFIEARGDYDAVHFHDDDLEDSRWEVAFELDIPEDLTSGVYAAKLVAADCEDHVPFFVTAPGRARADTVVLLPTLTYLAYANEHEILSNPPSYKAFTGREAEEAKLTWRDRYSVEQGLLSLYDVHRDGSSVCYASTRRPLLNLRPDYTWPLIDGPHGVALDLALMGWLEDADYDFDLLTDHDLDAAGPAALEPYRVVISGAHPEYWTSKMVDSLASYLGDGGRLLYVGGNGLHGVAGIDAERPHVAEVRRDLIGSRPSSTAPGELWMTTTAEQGGTWRRRGRPSHTLIGVGTTAMGAGPGRGYRRSPASHGRDYDWIFEGVDGECIGAEGGILGGAAAYEFDRADGHLGTPDHATVLATATDFEEFYYPMIEDFMGSTPEIADPKSPLVRADMVMAVGGNGGGAFSVGSAAWCGSLVDSDDHPTDAATITSNVLRRFLEIPRGSDPLRRERA